MDIKPVSEYKKPLYALGLATTIMAVSVTGCADFLSARRPSEKPTETVVLGGETTVVLPPKEHTNTDYDITPYLVSNYNFYLRTNVVTDTDQLVRFAVSKFDKISSSDDLSCQGRYQDYDFTVVRTDKFSEWIKNNKQYSDSHFYDGNFCVEYKRTGAESDLYLVYHDPSDRFMVLTDCCDNKVLVEFFTRGNSITAGSGGSTENTEFTGNTEFPARYAEFVQEEFYGRIMEAKHAFRWSKENHVVVFDDSKCISGKDMWEAFYYSAHTGKPAMVIFADHHAADKKKKTAETLDFYYINLEFREDGSADYYVAARRSDHKKPDNSDSLKYLKHFAGTDDIFVLTNDDDLTAEDAAKLKLGPNAGEYGIKHFVLKFEKAK
ncbi:MAG: hypothetical protein IKH06_01350 [Clostridiales bacterium]|nr:hypothetical protein [Clostridiales bacterium]